ncbi:hypothetical protein [Arthrobacter burdickii]|uniref:Uncharacterized protein n=1 Tax=Arthrobacter burdickii TaxID=3035920 RepID=A0ABT8K391_9MICC|nr:hypothetical protein [Arthrobacter burdickii]MDN4611920.1 hypothetical protein [Arthrobacter burdickii]
MTAPTTESRSGQAATLHGSSTSQGTASTTDPTRAEAVAILTGLLPKLWDEATERDGDENYRPQVHAVSQALHRDVNRYEVIHAMEACAAISRLQAGNCLVDMYGRPNTEEGRDGWLDCERQNLTVAIQNLTFGIPA